MRITTLFSRKKLPFYAALAVLILPLLLIERNLLQHTNGVFTLPGDEAFLQLSTAKTIAFKRIWGIGMYDFAAASSSLLYPLLLIGPFFIFGPYVLTVLLTNTCLAIILLIKVNRWLYRQGIAAWSRLGILSALVLLPALPLMIAAGTERTLLLLMVFLGVRQLYNEWDQPSFSKKTWLYAALMTATRYDVLLLIAAVCIVLAVRKRGKTALQLALAALSPVLVFGVIALSKGWYFIPNPFVVPAWNILPSYDWLIGAGIIFIVPWRRQYAPKNLLAARHTFQRATMGAATLLCAALLVQNLQTWKQADQTSIRLYREQYHIGLFAHRYYPYRAIASDNIGTLSYMTSGRYFDLQGLASITVARGGGNLTKDSLLHLSQRSGTQMAIVSNRYPHPLPDVWIKAGSWEIPRYGEPGTDIVSFYGTDSSWARQMKKNLEEYSRLLPHDITVKYPPYICPP